MNGVPVVDIRPDNWTDNRRPSVSLVSGSEYDPNRKLGSCITFL
jgi:hypothetical protein